MNESHQRLGLGSLDGSNSPMQERTPTRRGLWFDEFETGQEFTSPGRTLTETDLVQFAGLSGDYTALHTDEEFARRTPFRKRVAHGMLVQSIATGLGTRTGIFEGTIAALAAMRIEWKSPCFPGDTVRLLLTVAEIDPEPSKRSGKVRFLSKVLNQDDTVLIEGEWRTLILRDRQALRRRQPEETL